jgi:hypothetical protein
LSQISSSLSIKSPEIGEIHQKETVSEGLSGGRYTEKTTGYQYHVVLC